MTIDLILDRKNGVTYKASDFYFDVLQYEQFEIAKQMDEGTEQDVKKSLCDYIISNNYNNDICNYINSVNWLN